LSVGPPRPNQKAYFIKFSLPVIIVVLIIRVPYSSLWIRIQTLENPGRIRIWGNDTDPDGSGSAALKKRNKSLNLFLFNTLRYVGRPCY
jgi:hypothetical protein